MSHTASAFMYNAFTLDSPRFRRSSALRLHGLFRNPADFHFGIGLAMPDRLLVLLLTLEFEDQNFIAAAVAGDGRFYRRHIHQLPGVVKGRLDWKLDFSAYIAVQFLHAERIAGSDA